MDFKVIFGDIFLEDLEGIVGFIAAENPTAGAQVRRDDCKDRRKSELPS